MTILYCGCCTLLVFINVIYMIIGAVFMIIGILMYGFGSVLGSLLSPLIQKSLDQMTAASGLSINVQSLISVLLRNLSDITVTLIIVGIIIFVISIIGMCSACCKEKIGLIIYIAILSGIIFALSIAIIIFASNPASAQQGISNMMLNMIYQYKDLNSSEIESILINLIDISYSCCGSNNYRDFDKSTKFTRKLNQNYVYGNKNFYINATLFFPLSCCYFKDYVPLDLNECIKTNNSNMNVGCISKLFTDMNKYMELIWKIIGGIIGYQILIIIAAVICLINVDVDVIPV